MSEPFIAEIRIFTYNFAPRGWAFCNGQLAAIAQNTALFSLIGITYGGDGRTTMGFPNLEGKSPMQAGRGPGLTDHRLGTHGGIETVILDESEIPTHEHTMVASKNNADTTNPNGMFPAKHKDDAKGRMYSNDNPTSLNATFANEAVSSTGNNAHDNRQPFLVVSFCIALIGLYPSRS